MIYYPVLSQYSLTFGAPNSILRHVKPGSGLLLIATIPSLVSLLRIPGAAVGGDARASPDSPGAAAAAAPGGRRRRSARGRPRHHGRVLLGGRRPRGGVKRRHSGRRNDSSQPTSLAPGFGTCIASSHNWTADLRGRRGRHYRRRAGLRDPIATRLSASASASGLRGQRRPGSTPSSERAPGAAPPHAIFSRRRASLRAARQQQQVLLDFEVVTILEQT